MRGRREEKREGKGDKTGRTKDTTRGKDIDNGEETEGTRKRTQRLRTITRGSERTSAKGGRDREGAKDTNGKTRPYRVEIEQVNARA